MSLAPGSPSLWRRRPGRRAAAVALALGLGVLTGCSGDGDSSAESAATSVADEAQTLPTQTSDASPTASSSPSAPSPVTLQATEVDFAIELPQTDLAAGSYTIEVANEGDATHDLVIEDASGNEVAASEVIAPGQSGRVEVSLQPGEYVFYCSIGNHREMGMEVAVTVA